MIDEADPAPLGVSDAPMEWLTFFDQGEVVASFDAVGNITKFNEPGLKRVADGSNNGATMAKFLLAVIAREREACAMVCQSYREQVARLAYGDWPSGHTAAEECMVEIRERSLRADKADALRNALAAAVLWEKRARALGWLPFVTLA